MLSFLYEFFMFITAQDMPDKITPELAKFTTSFDAIQLAQLSAFAFSLPQLYLVVNIYH